MPLRITGMNSGLDTDSIISELVKAKKKKVDDKKKEQTKLQWKQDAWKTLNTKVLNLYQKTVGTMRFSSTYMKKTTKVANNNAVSVVTGENAVNGVQTMKVDRLAKAGYLTGNQLSGSNTADTKLSELDPANFGGAETGTISLNVNGTTTDINVNGDTKISDVVSQLKAAGVNANFDEKNQRLFISSKETGASNDFTISGDANALAALGIDATARKVDGQDAQITLNGAEFTSNTNVFEINGLTLTAMAETAEEFTVTTENDTSGIYNTIKNFLKEYNALINEMDKLYNADAAKGYEPLTDEEKDDLSDSEVEKWETKIKDSILRRDETLGDVSGALKTIMAGAVEVNGEKLYLSDFGINTLGYFNAAENEKGAYHIDGDEDDANTSGNVATLKNLISTDPDKVSKFFSQLSQNLYKEMSEMSSRVDGYRSFNSFYNDKKMQSDYTDYTSKIADLEDKLKAYEDKWYDKFAAMETAMSKINSGQNAITSLLGG